MQPYFSSVIQTLEVQMPSHILHLINLIYAVELRILFWPVSWKRLNRKNTIGKKSLRLAVLARGNLHAETRRHLKEFLAATLRLNGEKYLRYATNAVTINPSEIFLNSSRGRLACLNIHLFFSKLINNFFRLNFCFRHQISMFYNWQIKECHIYILTYYTDSR